MTHEGDAMTAYKVRPLSVSRHVNATLLNAVVNDASVRPWVGPGTHELDLSPVVADAANVLLMDEHGGCLFERVGAGTYEVHTQFLPEGRGPAALQAVRDALHWMFTQTDAIEIQTKVPVNNIPALALVKAIGGELHFYRDRVWETAEGLIGVNHYVQTIDAWAGKADTAKAAGEWFHGKLEAAKAQSASGSPVHDDDEAHDRYVGATVEMILAGQIDKGLWFYNRWARFAGYAAVAQIADSPPVIDIQDAILAIRPNDFEVLLCR